MLTPSLVRILVIDEIPLISIGLQEVLRSIYPAIRVEHSGSVFTALSSPDFNSGDFHLVILGTDEESSSTSLLLQAIELKERFGGCRIMVYTDQYSSELIAQTGKGAVDACVHKHESPEEIRKAYISLSAGEKYLSPIFDTLYHAYRLTL